MAAPVVQGDCHSVRSDGRLRSRPVAPRVLGNSNMKSYGALVFLITAVACSSSPAYERRESTSVRDFFARFASVTCESSCRDRTDEQQAQCKTDFGGTALIDEITFDGACATEWLDWYDNTCFGASVLDCGPCSVFTGARGVGDTCDAMQPNSYPSLIGNCEPGLICRSICMVPPDDHCADY